MAKGDRKYKQITQGVRLTPSQQRSVRRQIDKGVTTPTLKVYGQTVTVQQLRTTQTLVDRAKTERNNRRAQRPERLRYNSQGVATTKAGVQVTREQARAYRDRARRINEFNEREQFKATLNNVVLTSRNDTEGTTFLPTRARNAPLPYQRVDFGRFKSQDELDQAIQYQKSLYDPKTRYSSRSEYLGDTMKQNWIAALRKQVGRSEAAKIEKLLEGLDGLEFRALTDSGELDSVGDVYYGDAAEIRANLENYTNIIGNAAGVTAAEFDPEEVGLL